MLSGAVTFALGFVSVSQTDSAEDMQLVYCPGFYLALFTVFLVVTSFMIGQTTEGHRLQSNLIARNKNTDNSEYFVSFLMY